MRLNDNHCIAGGWEYGRAASVVANTESGEGAAEHYTDWGDSLMDNLAGTVGDLKKDRITHLLVYCKNYRCTRTGKLELGNYCDKMRLEAIRKTVYCPACRAAGRYDKNLLIY